QKQQKKFGAKAHGLATAPEQGSQYLTILRTEINAAWFVFSIISVSQAYRVSQPPKQRPPNDHHYPSYLAAERSVTPHGELRPIVCPRCIEFVSSPIPFPAKKKRAGLPRFSPEVPRSPRISFP